MGHTKVVNLAFGCLRACGDSVLVVFLCACVEKKAHETSDPFGGGIFFSGTLAGGVLDATQTLVEVGKLSQKGLLLRNDYGDCGKRK